MGTIRVVRRPDRSPKQLPERLLGIAVDERGDAVTGFYHQRHRVSVGREQHRLAGVRDLGGGRAVAAQRLGQAELQLGLQCPRPLAGFGGALRRGELVPQGAAQR